MSTSKKTPASVREGGPGSSHENAKKPSEAQDHSTDHGKGHTHNGGHGGKPHHDTGEHAKERAGRLPSKGTDTVDL